MKERPLLTLDALKADYSNALYAALPPVPEQIALDDAIGTLHQWQDALMDDLGEGKPIDGDVWASLDGRIAELKTRVTELYPESAWADSAINDAKLKDLIGPDIIVHGLQTLDWTPERIDIFISPEHTEVFLEPDHEPEIDEPDIG